MTKQAEIEADFREIYKESSDFFATIPRQNDYGYKIFNAPPLHKADVLFIGYQPSGGLESFEYEKSRGSHLTWPQEVEYATASWRLAVRIREMLEPAINLKNTVGLNAIFLRSPNITQYKRDVTPLDRQKVRRFCHAKIRNIVELLEPRKIIVIGLETLKLFGETQPDLINSRGNASASIGQVFGRDALGIIHLTGAHISRDDRQSLTQHVLGYLA